MGMQPMRGNGSMEMIERFHGERGKQLQVEAIKAQKLCGQDDDLAHALVEHVELRELASGETLIQQGASDNELYLILAGRLRDEGKVRTVAMRDAGLHAGEMALMNPAATRTATVVAIEATVVAQISEGNFSRIADKHSQLWKSVAIELADRLVQRRQFHFLPNEIPIVFIGSSKENLPVAAAIRDYLSSDTVDIVLWSEGVLGASNFPIEDLENQILASDFAVLVAGADDEVISREKYFEAPRDNVIFELGFFMGALTRKRTFLVIPNGKDLKIPSDLLGLTQLRYDNTVQLLSVALMETCGKIVEKIVNLGPK